MIKITVHQLLHDEMLGLNRVNLGLREKAFAESSIYLVRDGQTIFYIGKSGPDVVERMRTHLGQEFRGRSKLDAVGELIVANFPESELWLIEFYSSEECRWTIPNSKTLRFVDTRTAEWCMIRHYKPCLNVSGNHYQATPLPKNYKRPASRPYL